MVLSVYTHRKQVVWVLKSALWCCNSCESPLQNYLAVISHLPSAKTVLISQVTTALWITKKTLKLLYHPSIFSTCSRRMRHSIICVDGGGTEGKSRAANKHVWVLSTTSCGIWDKERHYGWPGALETPASLLLTPSGTSTHCLSATSHTIKTYLRTFQNSSKMANSIDLHWSRSEKKSKAFPRGKGTTTPTASTKVKGSEVSIICTYPHGDRPS